MSAGTVVVGASIAGVRTAQALRRSGYRDRIVLVGSEDELPYDKPPLSKQFLDGSWPVDRVGLLTRPAAADDEIELLLGTAAARLDATDRRVQLADGRAVAWDRLVIATGVRPRPMPWPTPGLYELRTLADSHRLRAALAEPGPVVIIGGGFIGAEAAAAARRAGHPVTIVDPLPVPIARVVGAEVGALFAQLHERHGVVTRFGAGVQRVSGSPGDLRIELTGGDVLNAATVIVGIGSVPNDAWLADSDLPLQDGVVCDEYCRAVGAEDVFAAGDIARWYHPRHGTHVRVEHWTNAVEQAACVAHNIAWPGAPQTYAPIEYVWSDQYDWKIQIVGSPQRAVFDRLLGEPGGASARFAALYRDPDGRLAAATTVNWPKAQVQARRLMSLGASAAEAAELLGAGLTPVAR